MLTGARVEQHLRCKLEMNFETAPKQASQPQPLRPVQQKLADAVLPNLGCHTVTFIKLKTLI